MNFLIQMRNNCRVLCLRNAIRPKTALSRDTSHVKRVGISLLFVYLSFIAEMKYTRIPDTNKQIVHLNKY